MSEGFIAVIYRRGRAETRGWFIPGESEGTWILVKAERRQKVYAGEYAEWGRWETSDSPSLRLYINGRTPFVPRHSRYGPEGWDGYIQEALYRNLNREVNHAE